jgi:SMC interacting uncharacterized protein involved in chromosome segregation
MFTGKIDDARKDLESDPHVMQAKFDDVIRKKTSQIQEYKKAVATMIAQKESKLAKIEELKADVAKLEKMKSGAKAKAQEIVKKLQDEGIAKEDIKSNDQYQQCLEAYNDFNSKHENKTARIKELSTDIDGYTKTVEEHKVQIKRLAREIEKVKDEATDSVADVMLAQQEQKVSDALSGISEDGTDKDLQELRATRQQSKANAKISKEIAETDATIKEDDFLEYARKSDISNEFEDGLFDDASSDTLASTDTVDSEVKSKLPEN